MGAISSRRKRNGELPSTVLLHFPAGQPRDPHASLPARPLFISAKSPPPVEKMTQKRDGRRFVVNLLPHCFQVVSWILRSYFSSTKSTSKGSSVKFSGRWLPPANHIVWPSLKRFSSVLPSGSVKREC